MNSNDETGSWREWSKHVLIELRRLNDNQESMNDQVLLLTENSRINTSSLTEHMRRTKAAEEQLTVLKNEVSPIRKAHDAVVLSFKFIGWTIAIAGTLVGIWSVIH